MMLTDSPPQKNGKHLHRTDMGAALIFLCILLIAMACGCSTQRRVIENPDVDDWDFNRMRYKNLFPPQYGYLEETELDHIDFRRPHEIGTRKYALLSDPRGDIDRTKGYDPTDYTVIPDLTRIQAPDHEVQITWIRHATFLVQIGGKFHILVDPVMAEIDGMVGKFGDNFEIGTLRADAPVSVDDLPLPADTGSANGAPRLIVLISHDHYDHLNYNTLEKLPGNTLYYVPHGLEKYFPARYKHVTGMDWYTSDAVDDLVLTFLPANHRSGRSMAAMNQSLWGGWLMEWQGYRIYFAGDTGYSAVFKDIRTHAGEMDICLMPTTSWFQRHWHFAPEDAIVAAEDLGCKLLIPWGWGTWIMSFEHILDPPRRLRYAWDRQPPQGMELRVLKMGETVAAGKMIK